MSEKQMFDVNTQDFNAMRGMLSEIERRIVNLNPYTQREFYEPIMLMIIEAYQDACNPNDDFLYPVTSEK